MEKTIIQNCVLVSSELVTIQTKAGDNLQAWKFIVRTPDGADREVTEFIPNKPFKKMTMEQTNELFQRKMTAVGFNWNDLTTFIPGVSFSVEVRPNPNNEKYPYHSIYVPTAPRSSSTPVAKSNIMATMAALKPAGTPAPAPKAPVPTPPILNTAPPPMSRPPFNPSPMTRDRAWADANNDRVRDGKGELNAIMWNNAISEVAKTTGESEGTFEDAEWNAVYTALRAMP